MHRSRAVLCGVLLALAVLRGQVTTRADEEPGIAERVRRATVGLASPREETRCRALADLALLVEEDPTRCDRAARALADLLRRRPPAEASQAAALLAALPGDKARASWLRALDPTRHPSVFLAAVAGAAHRRDDPRTHQALLERVRDPRAPLAARALALEALGALGGPAAEFLLSRPCLAEDGTEPWLLAAARAAGLARLAGEEGIPALLALLDHAERAPRVHAWEGLVALTGRALPVDGEAWRAWFAARRTPDADAPPLPVPAAGDRYALPVPVHVPRYYGVPIDRPSSHVVFCLDVSQSMYGRGIRQARDELTKTILEFPQGYAFDVIAFNENVHPFAEELWPAHPVVKHRVLAWLAERETISYTNLYDAVETGFGYAGVGPRARGKGTRLDAVFLLSDGAPNRGRYRREAKVIEAIAKLSGGRIPVHAVAAGEEVFPLLRQIAEATGGRFVDAFEFD